jgi:hypothetical protein
MSFVSPRCSILLNAMTGALEYDARRLCNGRFEWDNPVQLRYLFRVTLQPNSLVKLNAGAAS